MDLPGRVEANQQTAALTPDAAPRIPMQDTSIIPMAVLVVAGLGLAVGLILELDRVFRGDTNRTFEAFVFALAIVALVCGYLLT
jgi:hypothetical protein